MPNALRQSLADTRPLYWINIRKTNEYFGPFKSRRKAGRFLYGRQIPPRLQMDYHFWKCHGLLPRKAAVVTLSYPDYYAMGELIEADRRMGDLSP